MVNLSVIRRPSPRYANEITVNEDVTDILENPEESWSTLSLKLHRVADFVRPDDFSKSTILGKKDGFMKPFRDVLETYNILYESSDWGIDGEFGIETLGDNPFQLRSDVYKDPSFAEKISIKPSDNVIVIGDLHSGLQSLVHIIDDLVDREILSDDLELKKGYYIVLLGDLVDRGALGLEILHILMRIKVINFQNVIILNGNHDDISFNISQAFGTELETQLEHKKDIDLVVNVTTHFPTVLFMYFSENDEWIQLNHGGIHETYEPIEFIESHYDFHFHGFDDGNNLKYGGLRWTDFNGNITGIEPSSRGGDIKVYGTLATEDYLKRNNLKSIIRGHQEITSFMAMTRSNGSIRDLKGISGKVEQFGMKIIPPNHWKKVSQTGWETIKLVNAFDDFSVFTSSTANRARNLGMNVYIELTSSRGDFFESQRNLKQNMNEFENFTKELGLYEEFMFMIHTHFGVSKELSSEQMKNWEYTINFMKSAQEEFGFRFYDWLVLNSYNSIFTSS